MKVRLIAIAAAVGLALAVGQQVLALQTAHQQFRALNSYFDLTYREMTEIIGPPDVDDGVKGIVEWWSLGAEDVAFDYFYPDMEQREKPSSLKILFRTAYGHRRCIVDRQTDLNALDFARFYWLDCTGVIKTSQELQWRDRVYRDKMARLSAQPGRPAEPASDQAQ